MGAALGAAAGATRAALVDLGISNEFMGQLGASLPPGSAAVIVLMSANEPERVVAELTRHRSQVVQTSLSGQAEQRLRAALVRPRR